MSSSEESEIEPPGVIDNDNSSSASDTDTEAIQILPVARLLTKEHSLFNRIYDRFEVDHGKRLSRAERKREGYISSTLAYGEIMFESFEELFRIIKEYTGNEHSKKSNDTSGFNVLNNDNLTFVDIGCGTGKPVFAAALLHPFKKVIGVEILEDLYKNCVSNLQFWSKYIKPELGEERSNNLQFSFLHNDATLIDWSDADVVFMNSTCFTSGLMIDLSGKCKALKEGAIIISITRQVVGPAVKLIEERKMMESWGEATVYIQKRVIKDDE